MKRDMLKGILLAILAALVLFAVFVHFSGASSEKAVCVARALVSEVAFGNIEKVCDLNALPHAHR